VWVGELFWGLLLARSFVAVFVQHCKLLAEWMGGGGIADGWWHCWWVVGSGIADGWWVVAL